MRHTTLGARTGLRVSECALGTANFGTSWGGGASRADALAMLERFADANGTFIDTADCYQYGEAESIVGEFLTGRRDLFVVGSKFGYGASPAPHALDTGNSAKTMTRAVEASLKRLRTDYLDLYWVHFPDGVTPIEEILYAFDALVRAGKVLYIGLSNFPAWRVSRAAAIADLRGWAPVAAIQTEYSLVERSAERELLPMAASLGIGVASWSPLGGGLLTAKYRQDRQGRLTDWGGRVIRFEDSAQRTGILDTVLAIASESGHAPAQVALAWTLARARACRTGFVPVLGPRSRVQLDACLDSLSIALDVAQLARLDAASAIQAGSPHEVGANALERMLGGVGHRVEPRSGVPA
ncbi:aldo/keto reductase [Burkholderia sp. LMG 32019]|uniref:aldo/keto reductase n=1 Tax=Burkholderia sp. LMG 32019 TaxID=3158173 RepID=UPI003C2C5FE1